MRGGMAHGNKRVAVSHHARVKVAVPRAVLRRRQGGHTYPTHHGRGHGRRDCRCQQQRREKKNTEEKRNATEPTAVGSATVGGARLDGCDGRE